MYATKRRRRSLKGSNSKLCLSKGLYDNGHGNGHGPNASSSLKSNPSKRHRERLNGELERIAALLPFEPTILSKLDKLSILRLSVSYLRIKSYFQAIHFRDQTYNGYDNPTGHKTSLDHFSPDPSLTRTDSILKALNGFVLVLTFQGEVFFASSNIEEFLGFHQSDVIHQSVYELIHSEDRAELQKQLSWMGSPPVAGSRITPHELFTADNFQHLERNLTARFRCLLDNTSGFLRLEIRGRIGVLHGQNFHSSGDAPPGLLAICTPFGPTTLPDNLSKEAMFKSKLKLDLDIINIDAKGKELLGYTWEENASTNRSFYNCLHPDDTAYAATAHRELGKTNSCFMYAHRMLKKGAHGGATQQWQWLQTTMKIIPKNGKPDHVSAAHRPLSDEEGKDLVLKRASITKLCDLDPDASLSLSNLTERTPGTGLQDGQSVPAHKPAKPAKKKTSPSHNRENHNSHQYMPPIPTINASRRRKASFSTENILARNVVVNTTDLAQYSGSYHSDPASINYCGQNAYAGPIFLPATADQCSLLPYSSQYGSAPGFYSAAAIPAVDSVLSGSHSVNGTALLDRSYEMYSAAAVYQSGQEVFPVQGEYFKHYYKGMDGQSSTTYHNDPVSSTPKSDSTLNSWMLSSHHRPSVVVYNNKTDSLRRDSLVSNSKTWTDVTRSNNTNGGGVYSTQSINSPSVSAFSSATNQAIINVPQRGHELENKLSGGGDAASGGVLASMKTSQRQQTNHGFSICEATNTMLETAG